MIHMTCGKEYNCRSLLQKSHIKEMIHATCGKEYNYRSLLQKSHIKEMIHVTCGKESWHTHTWFMWYNSLMHILMCHFMYRGVTSHEPIVGVSWGVTSHDIIIYVSRSYKETKEPHIPPKEPCILSKQPHIPPKEPFILSHIIKYIRESYHRKFISHLWIHVTCGKESRHPRCIHVMHHDYRTEWRHVFFGYTRWYTWHVGRSIIIGLFCKRAI